MNKIEFEKKIFLIKYISEEDKKTHLKYVQIKLSKFKRDDKIKHIFQLINISSSILYN